MQKFSHPSSKSKLRFPLLTGPRFLSWGSFWTKMSLTHRLAWLLVFTLWIAVGCATTGSQVGGTGELVPEKESDTAYHLTALDRVELVLADGTKRSGKIDAQGLLQIEPDLHLTVIGLTPAEAEGKLRKEIPKIKSVHWTEFREASVSVLGEVYNQTKVDISDSPLRVLDVIAAAGGFTPLANLDNVVLVRRNAGKTEVFILNLNAAAKGISPQFNLLVEPGDVVTIRRSVL